jgi:Protein of unknown function (DUF2934)
VVQDELFSIGRGSVLTWRAVPAEVEGTGAPGVGGNWRSFKLKSKEPKEPKEKKKTEPKPRKSGEKSKRVLAQTVSDTPPAPHLGASEGPRAQSVNGSAVPVAVTIEAIAVVGEPPEELIRLRAYELFVERGYQHGYQLDDWLAAEREVKSKNRTT